MRIAAFIIALLLLGGSIDRRRLAHHDGRAHGPARDAVPSLGAAASAPALDVRLGAFVLSLGACWRGREADKTWLIALNRVTGVAAFMPRSFFLTLEAARVPPLAHARCSRRIPPVDVGRGMTGHDHADGGRPALHRLPNSISSSTECRSWSSHVHARAPAALACAREASSCRGSALPSRGRRRPYPDLRRGFASWLLRRSSSSRTCRRSAAGWGRIAPRAGGGAPAHTRPETVRLMESAGAARRWNDFTPGSGDSRALRWKSSAPSRANS